MRVAVGASWKRNVRGDLFGKWGVRHPYAAAFALLLSLPLGLLVAVSACTTVIVLPIAMLLGFC